MENLIFYNRFVNQLPADKQTNNYCRQVVSACYSKVTPRKPSAPTLLSYSKEVAQWLGLTPDTCQTELFTQVFSGSRLLDGMQPYAQCYGGHQFGVWAGQLGDGRAINLGEVCNQQGEYLTLQLKGAGKTPYARHSDGLAVLRSSVREFLCSEAMHHLGIPTTRALSLITTGDDVIRDMFYDGRPEAEPGAVVCRVSPSFTRFGSFQIYTARGDLDLLKTFVDYTLSCDFPHLGKPSIETYLNWFSEVCLKTAELIVHWQRVGFVHGVMNTDNMSILGLTIDYGPYGWLEDYNPHWTPNTTDATERRYCFGNQPQIGLWNLVQLANAIYPLVNAVEPLEDALRLYSKTFEQGFDEMMAAKLGFENYHQATDSRLINDLFQVLQLVETDMSIFFRKLSTLSSSSEWMEYSDDALIAPLMKSYYQPQKLTPNFKKRIADWLRSYLKRLQQQTLSDALKKERMNRVNPKYVLRNYLAQQAIEKATNDDYSMIEELLELLRHPYDEQPEKQHYAEKRPDWARHKPGCSMLSCSS